MDGDLQKNSARTRGTYFQVFEPPPHRAAGASPTAKHAPPPPETQPVAPSLPVEVAYTSPADAYRRSSSSSQVPTVLPQVFIDVYGYDFACAHTLT